MLPDPVMAFLAGTRVGGDETSLQESYDAYPDVWRDQNNLKIVIGILLKRMTNILSGDKRTPSEDIETARQARDSSPLSNHLARMKTSELPWNAPQ